MRDRKDIHGLRAGQRRHKQGLQGYVHHDGEPGVNHTSEGTLRRSDDPIQQDHKTAPAGHRRHHALSHAERRGRGVL